MHKFSCFVEFGQCFFLPGLQKEKSPFGKVGEAISRYHPKRGLETEHYFQPFFLLGLRGIYSKPEFGVSSLHQIQFTVKQTCVVFLFSQTVPVARTSQRFEVVSL